MNFFKLTRGKVVLWILLLLIVEIFIIGYGFKIGTVCANTIGPLQCHLLESTVNLIISLSLINLVATYLVSCLVFWIVRLIKRK
jgi:hypothetical protein